MQCFIFLALLLDIYCSVQHLYDEDWTMWNFSPRYSKLRWRLIRWLQQVATLNHETLLPSNG